MRGANLQGSDLRYAMAHGAFLQRADFRYANLRGANLLEANLLEANLFGADLRGADLRGVRGVSPDQVKSAKNWELAFYSADLLQALGLAPDHNEKLREEIEKD